MSATTAEATKSCPTCGAPISRPHLSLCAYCGSPLAIGGARSQAKDHAAMRRLAAMREHASFAEAERWSPPDGPQGSAARARARLAAALVLVGGSLAGLALAALGSGVAGASLGAAGIALALAGLVLWLRAAAVLRGLRALPVLARPALVLERRSRTSVDGGGQTVYFYDLMLEDGAVGEYRYPGRGGNQELLVAGNTGMAYTRRDELLAFRLIRV